MGFCPSTSSPDPSDKTALRERGIQFRDDVERLADQGLGLYRQREGMVSSVTAAVSPNTPLPTLPAPATSFRPEKQFMRDVSVGIFVDKGIS